MNRTTFNNKLSLQLHQNIDRSYLAISLLSGLAAVLFVFTANRLLVVYLNGAFSIVFGLVYGVRKRLPLMVKVYTLLIAIWGYSTYNLYQFGFFSSAPAMLTLSIVIGVIFLQPQFVRAAVLIPVFLVALRGLLVATGIRQFPGPGLERLNSPAEWAEQTLTMAVVVLLIYSLINSLHNSVKTSLDELEKNEQQINHLAYTDQITGLANQHKLLRQITGRIDSGVESAYLVVTDIAQFRALNSMFGTDFGDRILHTLGTLLQSFNTNSLTIARLRSNEFGMWIEGKSLTNTLKLISRIKNRVRRGLEELGTPQNIDFHIAIAAYPSDGLSVDECLAKARIALESAKKANDGRPVVFNQTMLKKLQREVEIHRLLSRGIQRNEITVVYQPKVNIRSGRIIGVEALARWTNEELGAVSPETFIPIATRYDMIAPLGRRIVERVFSDIPLIRATLGDLVTAVNISPLFFLQSNFVSYIISTADTFGVHPHTVCLEITEDVFIKDMMAVQNVIMLLQNAGFRITLDDFGKGYSSLYYISKLPFNELKVDKSFVDSIDSDPRQLEILKSICTIATNYRMNVVAEGIERQEQALHLLETTCTTAQGFFYARPVPLSTLVMTNVTIQPNQPPLPG